MFKIKYKYLLQKLTGVSVCNKSPVLNHVRQVKQLTGAKFTEHLHQKKNGHETINKPLLNESWGYTSGVKQKESEQEFLIRIKNDPDQFGEISEPDIHDEGDEMEEKLFLNQPNPERKLRTKQYADIIKGFIRQRKIKEAIDVLEVRMLKEDRVKPEAYIYNLLLGACGRVGYTKKAFMLYNDMKKRGLKVMGGTYTALFNACSNSPWPTTDGLTRAKHLYEIMVEKGHQPNETNYNAMIKAFGRCGDLPTAFRLVDDMSHQGFSIKADTVNFLMQACVSDKEAGFRHSLLVWRRMIEKNICPDIYTFNLLLRCVRECGLGDLETTRDVVEKILNINSAGPSRMLNLPGNSENDNTEVGNSSVEIFNVRPDLLAVKPHLGNILSLSEVKTPENRLILLGGYKGFLDTMVQYKCTPNIKTFTQLLDNIPSTNAAEKELLSAMKKLNVTPDIDFFNMLIKKKSMRCDYERAKEVLVSMKQMKYRPNLVTYGVLAIGCQQKEEALDLIEEMNSFGYTLNSAILGAMLHQACYRKSFDYIFEIMELCLKKSIPANKKFLEHLDEFKKTGKKKLEAKEFNKREAELFVIFLKRYTTWRDEVQIDETEDAHPWQQFRQIYPEEKTKYQVKDTDRFKPRHTSLFKVKTSKKFKKLVKK